MQQIVAFLVLLHVLFIDFLQLLPMVFRRTLSISYIDHKLYGPDIEHNKPYLLGVRYTLLQCRAVHGDAKFDMLGALFLDFT